MSLFYAIMILLENCLIKKQNFALFFDSLGHFIYTLYFIKSSEHFYFCRPIKGICGFSRETVIAVTSNIESMEHRRRETWRIGYPEHPRAGTSDDVEAFISLLHRFLGNIFTVKDMKSRWRKTVR